MLDYLERLRKKPVHTRKAVLLAATTAITGIIFMIWLSYWADFLKPSGGNIPFSGDVSAQTAAPTDLLKGSLRGFGGTLREGISEIKNQLKF